MKHLSTLSLTIALAIGLVAAHTRPTHDASPAQVATPATTAFELREVRTGLRSLAAPTLTGSAALCAKLAAMCDSGNQNACLQYDRICDFGN